MSVEISLIGSVCIEDVNLTAFISPQGGNPFFRLEMTQNQAIAECNAFDGFTLGPVQNQEQFNAIRQLIRDDPNVFFFDPQDEVHRMGFYVGLQAIIGQPDGGNTTAFSFVEQSFDDDVNDLDFYHVNTGEFPWGSGEPSNLGGNQDCAHLFFAPAFNGELDDVACESSTGFICRGACFEELEEKEEQEENEDDQMKIIYLGGLVSCGVLFLITLLLIAKLVKEKKKVIEQQHSFLRLI